MIPAKTFFPITGGVIALLAAIAPIGAQEANPPPRPESRIHDEGSIFVTGGRSQFAAEIQKKLDALQSEIGCDILIATVNTATGTTPRLLADQFAATWLKSTQNGAVLVYERSGNQLAISATEPVRDTIADYDFSAIEQSLSGDRVDMAPAEAISLAVNDLTALFRKSYGADASLDHPSNKADKILFGVVTACIVGLIAVVAALHWRGEKARA